MLTKILSTATLIVVAWLSYQMLHTQQSLGTSQASFQLELAELREEIESVSKQNEEIGDDVLARMDVLSEEQVKLANTAAKPDPKLLKAKDQAIANLKQSAAFQDAYAKVLKAGLEGHEKEGAKAAETLLSTKKVIWQTSDKWPKSKDALRGLMGPIDTLAAKWKRGDYTGDTKSIRGVLLEVLATRAKS